MNSTIWAVGLHYEKFLKQPKFCLSMLLFGVFLKFFDLIILLIFWPWKHWENTPKSSIPSRILVVSEIFPNTAQQPKWQNLYYKMWPIEQLYKELGRHLYAYFSIFQEFAQLPLCTQSHIWVSAMQLRWLVIIATACNSPVNYASF